MSEIGSFMYLGTFTFTGIGIVILAAAFSHPRAWWTRALAIVGAGAVFMAALFTIHLAEVANDHFDNFRNEALKEVAAMPLDEATKTHYLEKLNDQPFLFGLGHAAPRSQDIDSTLKEARQRSAVARQAKK